MLSTSGIRVMRMFIKDAVNNGNISQLHTLLHPQCELHSEEATKPGCCGIVELLSLFHNGFPDFYLTIDQLHTPDNLNVTAHCTAHCTHRGYFMGYPASGRQVIFGVSMHMHLENDKISELKIVLNRNEILRQLKPSAVQQESFLGSSTYTFARAI